VKYIEGVEEPQALIEAPCGSFDNVRGVSAVVRGNVQITSAFKTEDAQVFGIGSRIMCGCRTSAEKVTNGSLEDFRNSPNGVMVGRVLADRLQLGVGDSLVLAARGASRRVHVSAIYETGYRDIDKTNVYLHLPEARSLLKVPPGRRFSRSASSIPKRAPQDAARMEQVLRHSVRPGRSARRPGWRCFAPLRISTMITVSVFTLIASLAMFNTLAMIVLEKTKDIAILRSMGYERRDITQIFLWQAGIVLAIGAMHRRALRGGGDVASAGAVADQRHLQDRPFHRLVGREPLRPGDRDGRGDGDGREPHSRTPGGATGTRGHRPGHGPMSKPVPPRPLKSSSHLPAGEFPLGSLALRCGICSATSGKGRGGCTC
jgi:hypothetical protein